MGEEVKKVEEEAKKAETPAAVPETEKEEAAAAESKDDEKKEEAASKEPPSQQPPPCILGIDLHCTGCANKIKRCILRCKGVEGVELDMAQNQVTVKGSIMDLQGICERLRKRTMRNATVISPTEAEAEAAAAPKEAEPEPVVEVSEVTTTTVELLVNMHCEACAQQLETKVLKMRGVQSADANFGAGKLTVVAGSGMSSDRLVQYIHRRTGKLATIVPPPEPEPPKEEAEPNKADDGDKKPEEEDADKKDDAVEKKDAEGENKEADDAAKAEDGGAEKKEAGDGEEAMPELPLAVDGFPIPPEEMMKRMMHWPYPHKHYYNPQAMFHPYAMPTMQWTPPPAPPPTSVAAPMVYHQYYNYGMVERPAPAPQYFSDENPNACVIS